ncbi:hypothetical protein [Tuwongella immobilis]|uniref:Uncharacterized protein n=1 Tax=Tuwongella immobilis TaxID=692036 RepID=A0A6C2YMZ8_9BACT|nr:hypothetical protein [Tuwongella immobilis]VIP02978.1 unnamed protein product [Tuwongella immobilis]VTS03022.1 unnamed protein product [Tuwongella immobilis]
MQSPTNPVAPSEGVAFGKWVARGIAIALGFAIVKCSLWTLSYATGWNWMHILITGYPVEVMEPFMKPIQPFKANKPIRD